MTHCIGDTHIYLPDFDICICGASRWGVSGMIPKPYTIPYVPNPHHPRYQQQQPPAPEVPLSTFRAAQAVNATHLSADGSIAYDERQFGLWYCTWDKEARGFGSWYKMIEGQLPEDAVKLDK